MHHQDMSLKTKLIKAFWVPLTWMMLTLFDIVLFADGGPKNLISKVFESFVFLSNFLIYAMRWQLREINPASRLIIPVFLQFGFWWLVGVMVLTVLEKLKKRQP